MNIESCYPATSEFTICNYSKSSFSTKIPFSPRGEDTQGRVNLYDGKEINQLEEDCFQIFQLEDGQGHILSTIVHSR